LDRGSRGSSPPLCFTYKYRGGEVEKGNRKRRKKKGNEGRERRERREQREEKGEKRKENERKKQRRERKKKEKPLRPPQSFHRDNNTAVVGSIASTPP
jgi:hypothetical protein